MTHQNQRLIKLATVELGELYERLNDIRKKQEEAQRLLHLSMKKQESKTIVISPPNTDSVTPTPPPPLAQEEGLAKSHSAPQMIINHNVQMVFDKFKRDSHPLKDPFMEEEVKVEEEKPMMNSSDDDEDVEDDSSKASSLHHLKQQAPPLQRPSNKGPSKRAVGLGRFNPKLLFRVFSPPNGRRKPQRRKLLPSSPSKGPPSNVSVSLPSTPTPPVLTKEIMHPIKPQKPLPHSTSSLHPQAFQKKSRPWIMVDDSDVINDGHEETIVLESHTSHAPLPMSRTDRDHRYKVVLGDQLGDYIILKELGRGSFSVVVKAKHVDSKQTVALKIIRAEPRFQKSGLAECAILDSIHESHTKVGIIEHQGHFTAFGHMVIVYPLHKMNLYQALKRTHRGFSLSSLAVLARQLLRSLQMLRDCQVMHCDIKPENIVLKQHGKATHVTLIDFGSASFTSQGLVQSYIQSRFYRAPEVVLGVSDSFSCALDMWSLGCLLFELHAGSPLFSVRSEKDLLLAWIRMFDYPPDALIESGSRASRFFYRSTSRSPKLDPKRFGLSSSFILKESAGFRNPHFTLRGRLGLSSSDGALDPSSLVPCGPSDHWSLCYSVSQYSLFADLLSSMLSFDPSDRITPSAALQHPFFHANLSSLLQEDS